MNNFPNVLKIAKAQKHRSTFPLSFKHQTTMDIGKTCVLHSMEVMPNDEIDINLNCFSQLAPLVMPTMGEVQLYVRAFFVPYRFTWKHWEEFFANLSHAKGKTASIQSVPLINSDTIWHVLTQSKYSTHYDAESGANIKKDFYEGFSDGPAASNIGWVLNPLGRLAQQILHGLGYTVMPHISDGVGIDSIDMSALPLLALAKVFRDYYVNPNYDYVDIDSILDGDFLVNVDRELSNEVFETLIDFVSFGWFENDLFTSAWANPESVGYTASYKSSSVIVNTDPSEEIEEYIYSASQNNNGSLTNINSSDNVFSQRGLNVLKSIYNFSLRQAAAGVRYVDQLLARFGIRMPENEARRALFLGSSVFDTQISRVDATSTGSATFPDGGTLYSALGDFTGRGVMSGNGHFHFKNDKNDFGMLFFVAHLMPRTDYYQGLKPHVNHIYFNDFFNPDLEDIGNAPIKNSEVFADWIDSYMYNYNNGNQSGNHFLKGVFGFAPNYYEYKSQMSYLTGDFRCNSINAELNSFQLMRKFHAPDADSVIEDYNETTSEPVLNEQFQKFNSTNVKDYNRIWLTKSDSADHFIMSFYFDVRATRDCNSLGNSLLAELNMHGNDVGDLVKVRPNGKYF